jgi:Ras-related protein Rab-1A
VCKTSLIRRYCTGTFEEPRVATIGVDFQIKIVEVEGKIIKLSIWDIAGQERFGAFRDTFYRGARAVAMVYAVTQPVSAENLPRWNAEITRICPTAQFMVVGNKIDLERRAEASPIKEWASSLNYPYVETSALNAQGVNECFALLAHLATRRKK